MEVGVAEMALIVSALACGAALVGAARNSRNDASADAAEAAAVVTKLDFIGNDLKDLKAEYRATRNEARAARDLAERASARADEAYERAWLDRKVSPKFTMGRTCAITWTKDTIKGSALEAWVMEHRNDVDVACEVCRVFTWMGEATAMTADKAAFLFTADGPTNGTAGQPVVTGGTLNMVDDGWTEGTWNSSAPAFTVA